MKTLFELCEPRHDVLMGAMRESEYAAALRFRRYRPGRAADHPAVASRRREARSSFGVVRTWRPSDVSLFTLRRSLVDG